MQKLITAFVVITCFSSCSYFSKHNKEKPLAQVSDRYLYKSDLESLIKPGLSKEDSAIMVAGFIEKWIRKELIVEKAQLNLTSEEKNVEKELEEYRTSLLVYKYEAKLLQEKLDSVVDNKDIEDYYNKNSESFSLNDNIVKALYVKLPHSAPNIDKVRAWIKSDEIEDLKNLDTYCFQFANRYDFFNDDWVNFSAIKLIMPIEINNNADFFKNTKYIETTDSAYIYFISIHDYKLKGTIPPIKFVFHDIRNIILLKRKQKFINELENRIYFDALNKNSFKIFKY